MAFHNVRMHFIVYLGLPYIFVQPTLLKVKNPFWHFVRTFLCDRGMCKQLSDAICINLSYIPTQKRNDTNFWVNFRVAWWWLIIDMTSDASNRHSATKREQDFSFKSCLAIFVWRSLECTLPVRMRICKKLFGIVKVVVCGSRKTLKICNIL